MKTKEVVHIEVFPADKTCGQGCDCPLAQKTKAIPPNLIIDTNVQTSFTLLESIIADKNSGYIFDYSGPLKLSNIDLVPKIAHTEALRGLRLGFGKHEHFEKQDGNAAIKDAMNFLIKLLKTTNSLFYQNFCFTLVPKNLYVTTLETAFIKNMLHQLGYLKETTLDNFKVQFDIRSNFAVCEEVEKCYQTIKRNDRILIHNVLNKFLRKFRDFKPQNIHEEDSLRQNNFITLYYSLFRAKDENSNTLIITNRAIARTPKEFEEGDLMREMIQTLSSIIPDSKQKDYEVPIGISPKGIVLNHISKFITNPLFWVSHSDFSREIIRRSERKDFLFKKLLIDLIKENLLMYHELCPAEKSFTKTMEIFESRRSEYYGKPFSLKELRKIYKMN